MKNELISIIVPIYKVEKYLKQCIDSIINQTYKNLEIILVDDGSPDNCGKICDEYANNDKRIKVIHKENGGLSSARNAGLDIATGEYISFIDSDDYVSEIFIERLYDLCKKNDAEISVCDFIKFIDKIEETNSDFEVKKYTSMEMQERMYSEECAKTVVVWNKLYQKHIYENLFFPEGKINEDEFTTYKSFDKTTKNIVVTNEPLYYYRYNENSIMGRKFNEKRLDVLEAYEERKKYYYDRQYDNLFKKTIREYIFLLERFYILISENIEKPEKHLKCIKDKIKENYKLCLKYKIINVKEIIKIIIFIINPQIYLFIKKKILHIKKGDTNE